MKLSAIAAVSESFGIGKEGKLLFKIPEDLSFFRHKTEAATVIMGRETLMSLPGASPLKGRRHIVLSTNPAYTVKDALISHNLDELFAELSRLFVSRDDGSSKNGEVFVCGGEQVYRELYPYCSLAYVTKVHADPPADRFFPDLGKNRNWEIIERSGLKHYENLSFEFLTYRNNAVIPWNKQ